MQSVWKTTKSSLLGLLDASTPELSVRERGRERGRERERERKETEKEREGEGGRG